MSTSNIGIYTLQLIQPEDTSSPNFPRVAKESTDMMMGRATIEHFKHYLNSNNA